MLDHLDPGRLDGIVQLVVAALVDVDRGERRAGRRPAGDGACRTRSVCATAASTGCCSAASPSEQWSAGTRERRCRDRRRGHAAHDGPEMSRRGWRWSGCAPPRSGGPAASRRWVATLRDLGALRRTTAASARPPSCVRQRHRRGRARLGCAVPPKPQLWATAVAAWEATGFPLPAAYCQLAPRRGGAGRLAVSREEAADLYDAASTGALELGAKPLAAAIEQSARRARLRGRRRPSPSQHRAAERDDGFGITARELEVLELLARGWTNKQIAESLFISEKTARVHVSHLLSKLACPLAAPPSTSPTATACSTAVSRPERPRRSGRPAVHWSKSGRQRHHSRQCSGVDAAQIGIGPETAQNDERWKFRRRGSTVRAWGSDDRRNDDVPTIRVETGHRRSSRRPPARRVRHGAADGLDDRRARHVRWAHRRGRPAPRTRRWAPAHARRQGQCPGWHHRCRATAGRRRLPAGPLRRRLARLLDVRALLRLVEMTSQRTSGTKRNADGKVTAAVTVHDVPTVGGVVLDRVVVEAIELTGYAKSAGELRDLLDGLGLRAVDGDLAELAAASAGVPLDGYGVSIGIPLTYDDPAIDGYRAVLANLRDALLANWDGTVDDIDPEFLHDLRVAVRRTRVVLANAAEVLPDDVRQRARDDFAWLGEISGTARDLDVYQIEWPDYTADARCRGDEGARPAARAPRRATRRRPRRAVRPALLGAGELPPSRRGTDGSTRRSMPRHSASAASIGWTRPCARRIRRAHRVMIERGPNDHPGDTGRDGPRAAQGRQEAALPHRVLRWAVRQAGAHRVRRAPQGAAGHARRAPGRRGPRPRPAHDRRRSAAALGRRDVAGDRSADRAPRAAPRGHAGTSSPNGSASSTRKETVKALEGRCWRAPRRRS